MAILRATFLTLFLVEKMIVLVWKPWLQKRCLSKHVMCGTIRKYALERNSLKTAKEATAWLLLGIDQKFLRPLTKWIVSLTKRSLSSNQRPLIHECKMMLHFITLWKT